MTNSQYSKCQMTIFKFYARNAVGNFLDVCQLKPQNGYFSLIEFFYVNTPINNQNDHVWSRGNKVNVSKSRLLIERAKFAPHVMHVSDGVCYGHKGRLHFIDENAKGNAKYYAERYGILEFNVPLDTV